MSDCLFCRIIAGEIPADIVYQDELILAFRDINPEAPTHLLIIPKKHIADVSGLEASDAEVLVRIFTTAARLAEEEGITEGYRLVANTGLAAGQTIFHLHFHLLGGRVMAWPPG